MIFLNSGHNKRYHSLGVAVNQVGKAQVPRQYPKGPYTVTEQFMNSISVL